MKLSLKIKSLYDFDYRILFVFKNKKILKNQENFRIFFIKYMRKIVGAGARAEIFDKLKPEPHKNQPAPQHCFKGNELDVRIDAEVSWKV
jgi:hypothetical protein